jgi:hypothetical protein
MKNIASYDRRLPLGRAALGLFLFSIFVLFAPSALHAQQPNIPALDWTPRSDWLNVKTGVTPAAVGDGVADDTAALQAALNRLTINGPTASNPKIIYLPAGTYRITQTLIWPASVGCSLIGHGRNTIIRWDGPDNQDMLRTQGAARADFIGLTWDGVDRGKGVTGFRHNANSRFESANRHQHNAFLNLANGLVGNYGSPGGGTQATSEMVIDNCLFSNCGTGIKFRDSWNYYNETITRSEFRDCGIGVAWGAGYGYVRFCHFENSTITDILGAERCSVRFCTSTGSAMFYRSDTQQISAVLQNNVVSNYTATSAVTAGFASFIFDNVFLNPPGSTAPIWFYGHATYDTRVEAIVSNNQSPSTAQVYTGKIGYHEVPPGRHPALPLQATDSFLQTTVTMPARIFDAKVDFGARANGSFDDTAAVQATINAAKAAGNGALAYFPGGKYRITSPILVDGQNYTIAGIGYFTEFAWNGPANGVVFHVVDPQNVRLEYISMLDHLLPVGTTAIRQTSNGGPSSMTYDRLLFGDGPRAYSLPRKREGIHLVNLPANATVHMGQIVGTVRMTDSGQATILGEMLNTSGDLIDGASLPKTGFTGFLTRNGLNLIVEDNNDIVVADSNMEQSSLWNEPDVRAVRLSGGSRAGGGQVTVGGMKINLFDSRTVTEVENYEGLFSFAHARMAVDQRYHMLHTGRRPVELLLASNSYATGQNLFQIAGPGASYRNVRGIHDKLAPSEWYSQGARWVGSEVARRPDGPSFALNLDGENDFIFGSGDSLFTNNLTAMTIQTWIKLDLLNRASTLVTHGRNDITSNNVYALEIGTNNKARFMVRNNTSPYPAYETPWSTTTLTTGQWYLLTGVWTGTQLDIYVNDGPSEGTSTTPAFGAIRSGGNSHLARLLIGGQNGRFFSGSMDELRFYKAAKDQSYIDTRYNSGLGIYGTPDDPDLLLGHHMDEGTDKNVYDYKTPGFSNKSLHAQLYEYNAALPPDTNESLKDAMDHFRELAHHAYALNFGSTLNNNSTLPAITSRALIINRQGRHADIPLLAPEAWFLEKFGNHVTDLTAAFQADPDGDGLPNLLEYALAHAPLVADASPSSYVVQTDGTGRLQLGFLRHRADLVYTVEASSDLLTWTPIATDPGTISPTVPVVVSDPTPGPRRFLRLRVTPR